MPQFNKGDRVVRVKGSFRSVKEGGIYTVRDHSDRDYLFLEGHDYSFDDAYFALVAVKPMTLDAAHRLVAMDCEVASLQASLDNKKEAFERAKQVWLEEIAELAALVEERDAEFSALKLEYGVER